MTVVFLQTLRIVMSCLQFFSCDIQKWLLFTLGDTTIPVQGSEPYRTNSDSYKKVPLWSDLIFIPPHTEFAFSSISTPLGWIMKCHMNKKTMRDICICSFHLFVDANIISLESQMIIKIKLILQQHHVGHQEREWCIEKEMGVSQCEQDSCGLWINTAW